MSKELITKGGGITSDLPPIKITREDITKHFCPKATANEVAMALAIVKSLNLNPFLREVHFIKYSDKDKMAIVVGYEVYLKRAERSGKLNGWTAGINAAENFAWVKIWRKDWSQPFEWSVNLDEFNKKQSTWNQIPSFMGRKVAIAQGFRMCFPDELGGLPYTEDEHKVYDIVADAPQSSKPQVAKEPQALPASAQPSPETTTDGAGHGEQGPQPAETAQEVPITPERKLFIENVKVLAMDVFEKDHAKFSNWLFWNHDIKLLKDVPVEKQDEVLNGLRKEFEHKVKK